MQRSLITPQGHARLVQELKHAKEVLRPQVVQDIAEARAHGDISENSEYEDAKERQGLLEGRIRLLESMLATAEVHDISTVPKRDRIIFGSTVDLLNLDTDEEVTYQIVSDYESDVKEGRISYTSPIGRALIGKSSGEEVTFQTPNGDRSYEILDIHYR
ncbi:MAG: transcription elongation factor GreA [Alphaproteobacteria bacterium]|nr:transcription elongation factor GreA [Alphaproteobacteria bacterium]